jgi:hypothetical protein
MVSTIRVCAANYRTVVRPVSFWLLSACQPPTTEFLD